MLTAFDRQRNYVSIFSMKKRFPFVIIVFLLLLVSLFYFTNIYLAKEIRRKAAASLSRLTGQKSKIGSVEVKLTKGIILKGISLSSEKEKTPWLYLQSVRIKPLIIPFILKRSLIIYAGDIKEGYANIIIDKEGKTNLPLFSKKKDKKTKRKFFIKGITIKNLNINFTDRRFNIKKHISRINFSAKISPLLKISFKLQAALGEKTKNNISFKGNFNLRTKTLSSQLSLAKMDLTFLKYYLNRPPFSLKKCLLGDMLLKINGKDEFSLSGWVNLSHLEGKFQKINFSSAIVLKPEVKFNTKNEKISGQVQLEIQKGEINNVFRGYTLKKVNGKLSLTPHLATIQNISGLFRKNPFNVKGSIENFRRPYLNLVLNYQTDTDSLSSLLKDFKINAPRNIKASVSIFAAIKGPAQKAISSYKIKGSFNKIELKHKNWQDLKIKNAFFYLNPNQGKLNIALSYKAIPIRAKLKVDDFNQPKFLLEAASEQPNIFNFTCSFAKEKKAYKINSLGLKLFNSAISALGSFDPSEGLKLKGISDIETKDIPLLVKKLNPKSLPLITKLNPQGKLRAKFIYTQKPKNKWELKAAGKANQLRLYNLSFPNPIIEVYANPQEIIISPFQGDFYEGKIDFRLKLSSKEPSVCNIIAQDINLKKLHKDIEAIKNSDYSGTLSLEADFKAENYKDLNTLTGQGKAVLSNGKIWEISLLQGLGKILFIPEFGNIIFENGYAEFLIKERKIFIDQLELDAPEMILTGQGRISFSGDIDFLFSPSFNTKVLGLSKSFKKLTTDILSKNGLAIEVTGTLKKPQFKMEPAVFAPLQHFKDIFSNFLFREEESK